MNTQKKLLFSALVIILLLISFLTAYSDFKNDHKIINNIELVQKKLTQLTYIDNIITQLQKERGLSAIYYDNHSKKYAHALEQQRKKTDYFIKKASSQVDIKELSLKRDEAIAVINRAKISRFDAFMNYTTLIKSLLLQSEDLIFKTKNSDIKNSLIYYHSLNIMQEAAGELRGLIGGILTTKTISREEYNEIIILKRILAKHYKRIKGKIKLPLNFKKENSSTVHSTINQITNITSFNDSSLQNINIEPLQWFEKASSRVNLIRESTLQEIDYINSVIETSMNEAITTHTRHLLLWSFATITILIVISIAWMLFNRLLSEQKLLQNYKKVIDENPNSIVSKTDMNGRITYVNDNFCHVSKFTRDELIGKSHNIIRHMDVDNKTFKELWSTIQSGKTWSGILKNRSKDGESYWVDVSISPVYNDKGILVEY
ncbi:MAG: nitrate- and nitrite sensing domain-containing protein, partial [Sulfurimonas sp.]|nr:nitrate- and nitrite sensing domain-containing protein [Sulfurimonas sp.]